MAFKPSKVGDVAEAGDAFTTTEVETEKFSFTWDIKNFPELKNDLLSPVFKGGPRGQNQWKLQLQQLDKKKCGSVRHPAENQEEGDFGIYLHLNKSGERNEVDAGWRFSLLDSNRKILKTTVSTKQTFNSEHRAWGWEKWLLRSQLVNPANGFLLESHKLRIHCEIFSFAGVKHQAVSTKSVFLKKSDAESVQKKIMSLLALGKFSDVTLETETESFPCTKFVLAAHSPVFEAMFDSGMLEATQNTVKIVDFSAHVVQGMIQFLYTGETKELEENAGAILSIADKYQISGLKIKCEQILLKNLKVESAAETLILAHFLSPQILKPQVIYFINRMKKQVENTDGYKNMIKTHPIVCCELYAALE